MDFLNRIKKEMSEGIVKAILEHYEYRVIDTGIEKVIREISCLPEDLYIELGFPDALRRLPDFIIMDKEQKTKTLVDIKYRSRWDINLLFDEKIRLQLEIFKKITLIVINGNPPEPTNKNGIHDASEAYIRCIDLKIENKKPFVNWRGRNWVEIEVEKVKNYHWFSSLGLRDIFENIPKGDHSQVIENSVKSLSGIIDISKSTAS